MSMWLYPQKILFSNKFMSIAKSNAIVKQDKIGPIGGTSIDEKSILTITKAISESIDRRSSMIWAYDNDMVDVLDLAQREIVTMSKGNFSLDDKTKHFIDTTGIAAHTRGQQAAVLSIFELFQKNALFFIWYKKLCFKSEYKGSLVLLNLDFSPSIHSLLLLIENGRYFFGMGSGMTCEESMRSAYEEAKLLRYQDFNAYAINFNKSRFRYSAGTITQYKYFLRIYNNVTHYKNKVDNIKLEEKNLFNLIPEWIEHLSISKIPNNQINRLVVVKAYSEELYNSLPFKKIVVETNHLKNSMFIIKDISSIPDIPSI